MEEPNSRLAIVTGASRGLGRATAWALSEAGWDVIIDAREPQALTRTAEEIGPSVMAMVGDVADPTHRDELVAMARDRGGLDLLVNNASILGPSPQPPLAKYPLDTLRQVYEVNVLAPLALTQLALPLLRERRGIVINVTSDAAAEPYEGWGGYGSSKAALNQISSIMGAEEPEVAIYRFDPGDMNTQMHQEAFPGEDISDRPPPDDSVPALMAIVAGRPQSGSYGVGDVLLTS